MENVVRRETRGEIEAVEAKYELLKRGAFLIVEQSGGCAESPPGR